MEKTYKTFESRWHNPVTGVDIVVARGDSEEYVRKMAQMAQFIPYEIVEYQTEDNVREMYRDWRKANGNQKPNRVVVRMKWDDEDNTLVDTVAILPQRLIGWTEQTPDDCWIVYYVSSLKELLSLTKPGNGSDFTVLEVLEFWKRK